MSDLFHKEAQANWSKPSYEMIFTDSICIYDDEQNCVYLIMTPASRDVIKEIPNYTDKVSSICNDLYDVEIDKIHYISFKEYMIKMKRAD
ncbi:hypothetical protein AAAC51_07035 [Priestia megaterium]